jgi:hypothetical protein
MATTTVSDFVIWTKHIHGDGALIDRILGLKPSETIDLVVDGVRGTWRKMDDGKDGRPTRGVRPIGRAADVWRSAFESRRGAVVGLELPAQRPNPARAPELLSPALGRSEGERHAALEAFLAAGRHGWRSDEAYGPRDELYDRE